MQTASGATLDGKRVVALAASVGAGLFFWDSKVLWPLKMLVVTMHESGHALAALLVGGSVRRISLAADQSGYCISQIPDGFFAKMTVYSAGYVGSAIAGGLLLLLTYRFRARRAVLVAASAWLAITALAVGGDAFTIAFCLGAAAALGGVARFLPDAAVEVLNLFLAAFASLYAAMDLRNDLWNSAVREHSDAALLADVTAVPAVVWAAAWNVFSISILAVAAWWSVKGRSSSPRSGEPTCRASPSLH